MNTVVMIVFHIMLKYDVILNNLHMLDNLLIFDLKDRSLRSSKTEQIVLNLQ